MTRRSSACLVLLAAAVACGSDDPAPAANDPNADDPSIGGQTGEEDVGCLAVESRNLAWSELSPLGFSADALLSALGTERETRLDWADGSSSRLSLTLERRDGAVAFEEREWTEASSGAEPAIAQVGSADEDAIAQCNDVVSLPVTLSVATNDGAFAEQLSFRLLAESTTRATGSVTLDTQELTGSFRVTEVDPAAYDRVLVTFELTLGSEAWRGRISGQAVDDGDGSSDGTTSARLFQVGSF
jgi:hypothetical protein